VRRSSTGVVGPHAAGAFAAQTAILDLVRRTRDDLYAAGTGRLCDASARLRTRGDGPPGAFDTRPDHPPRRSAGQRDRVVLELR
jgi:hypothetical protein